MRSSKDMLVMRTSRRSLIVGSVFLVASAWLLLSQIAVGAETTGSRIICGLCEEADRFVRLQDQSEVRRSTDPRQFTHPLVLSPAEWTTILTGLRVQRQAEGLLLRDPPGPVIPAFTAEEIEYLSTTLSKAFAQAQPHEWVVFGLARPNAYRMTEVTTGGWFVEGPSLHLVLANYRKAVTMPSIRQLLWERPLRRDAGPDYDLVAGRHQVIVRDSSVLTNLFSSAPSELSMTYQAVLLSEPVEAIAPQELPASSSDRAPGPASIEDRLRVLQRLHTQGLITEEEYRTKKQQILERF